VGPVLTSPGPTPPTFPESLQRRHPNRDRKPVNGCLQLETGAEIKCGRYKKLSGMGKFDNWIGVWECGSVLESEALGSISSIKMNK
jgi:hypothetical protein